MVTLGAGFGEGESAARLTEDSAAMYRVSLREMTWARERLALQKAHGKTICWTQHESNVFVPLTGDGDG